MVNAVDELILALSPYAEEKGVDQPSVENILSLLRQLLKDGESEKILASLLEQAVAAEDSLGIGPNKGSQASPLVLHSAIASLPTKIRLRQVLKNIQTYASLAPLRAELQAELIRRIQATTRTMETYSVDHAQFFYWLLDATSARDIESLSPLFSFCVDHDPLITAPLFRELTLEDISKVFILVRTTFAIPFEIPDHLVVGTKESLDNFFKSGANARHPVMKVPIQRTQCRSLKDAFLFRGKPKLLFPLTEINALLQDIIKCVLETKTAKPSQKQVLQFAL